MREVNGGKVISYEWTPADFGLAPCSLDDLRVEDVEASAALIRRVLTNEDGPATRMVLANAAAALLAAERVTDLQEGVALAAEALASGRAQQVLANLRTASRAGTTA